MADLAAAYEQRYPGTGVSAAQAEEREQRIRFKQGSRVNSLRRRNRTQGIRVPEWSSAFDENGRLRP